MRSCAFHGTIHPIIANYPATRIWRTSRHIEWHQAALILRRKPNWQNKRGRKHRQYSAISIRERTALHFDCQLANKQKITLFILENWLHLLQFRSRSVLVNRGSGKTTFSLRTMSNLRPTTYSEWRHDCVSWSLRKEWNHLAHSPNFDASIILRNRNSMRNQEWVRKFWGWTCRHLC